jgi:aspartyl-tRNA(Asn)/glutamyl-tRNA(Gln) amidotransferase subunit A
VTHHPLDATRVAGGTSGGSAAAVASDLAVAALGTDTGGSVRNPASYCGVLGLKPTYGSVSRSGIIAAASSFDQVGPLTKSVADARTLFSAIRGRDPKDGTTYPDGLYPEVVSTVRTVGVPWSLLGEGLDARVRTQFEKTLRELGLTVVDIELPTAAPSLAAYYIINFAEVSTNLARFDGVRYGHHAEGDSLLEDYVRSRTEGFGTEALRRIILGTFVLSSGYIDAYYRKATAAREALRQDYAQAFAQVDVVATPTMPTPAFRIGEKADPLSLYLEDVFTVLANLTGLPAISVPMGTVEEGSVKLPVGIHFMAPHGGEERLFVVGEMVENRSTH